MVIRTDTGDHPLSLQLSAAVRAVTGAGGEGPVLTPTETGRVAVSLGGVALGHVSLSPGPRGGRGWQAAASAAAVLSRSGGPAGGRTPTPLASPRQPRCSTSWPTGRPRSTRLPARLNGVSRARNAAAK